MVFILTGLSVKLAPILKEIDSDHQDTKDPFFKGFKAGVFYLFLNGEKIEFDKKQTLNLILFVQGKYSKRTRFQG